MVYAAARAAVQEDLWRLLAYSSISQMGLVALGAGLGTSAGLTGAVLHLVADSVTKGALLLSAAMILVAYGARRRADLVRLRGRAPWVWVVFLLGGLSLVGVPPLPGFYGKWYVLKAALELGHWPAVAAVTLGTLATIVYVFRLIEALYLTPRTEAPAAVELPDGRTGPLGSLALLLLLVVPGLLAAPLVLYVIGPALPGGL
jgi:multicomponent Na+:H+ antiporter subunit D